MGENDQPNMPLNEKTVGRVWPLWFVVFIAGLLLYTCTMNRGVQWQDSGWQQCRIVSGQLDHPLGLALTHPVQYYLGRAATKVLPIEPAMAITTVSCIAASIAIANVVLIIFIGTRNRSAALIAGAGLMLSHTFWQHATHTESYAIVTALLTGEWLCWMKFFVHGRRSAILGVAFLNGLGVANHLLAGLAAPVNAVMILLLIRRKEIAKRYVLTAPALWILGSLPYSLLIIATFIHTGDLSGTVRSALFGNYASEVLNTQNVLKPFLLGVGYWLYNFPNLIIPLAFVGLFRQTDIPKTFSRSLKALLVIYLIFVLRYSVKDQYTFFLPVYALTALFAGFGFASLVSASTRKRTRNWFTICLITILWTPALYIVTASVLEKKHAITSMVGNKPYRNGYKAFFYPWGTGQNHATKLNQHAFSLAQPNGLILTERGMIRFALDYDILLGRVPQGVEVMFFSMRDKPEKVDEIRKLLAQYAVENRPVVLIPENRDRPQTCIPEAVWKRNGDLYVLETLKPTDSN